MKHSQKTIDRREFLKVVGAGTVASTAALYGCKPGNSSPDGTVKDGMHTDSMTYRINPSTGDRVSLLGYGCMRWPLKPAHDGKGEEIDQEAVNELVDYAIANGVNYFDTAPVYVRGWSETATGIALKRHPRDQFFIATKMSNQRGGKTLQDGIDLYHQSLRDLQVDYIDYYLLHGAGMGGMQAIQERFFDNGLLDYLLKEREAGRIRNLGWSFHGEVEVFDFLLAQDIHWDFVQIQLNYVDWKHASGWNIDAEYLYNELLKRNIPAVVMEPLLGGRLAQLPDHLMAQLKQRRPEDSIASWAFRYAGTPQNVLTALSGMTYMEHLKENIRTYSPLQPITEEENALLEATAEMMIKYPLVPCTACQYCMPCPYGINIPGVFAHYNRCVNEGNIAHAIGSEHYRQARRAFLIGYDRSIPKPRQADHCIGCKICAPHCPQRIDIPQEMQRIDTYTEQLKQH